ncbi:MAG: PrsW family glutamic-type intramembrane protease [Hyphomicrobiales bacterium]
MEALRLLVGLLPVVLFLAGLLLLDSYKLVTRRGVALSLAAGVAAALVALVVNGWFLGGAGLDERIVTRYVAPVVEESLKAAFVLWLIRAERVGFMVDAGIHGFAAGTGFALVENLYYAGTLGDAGLGLWIVRGLGTAVMHGSTTAIVGILSKNLVDRHESKALVWLLPGLSIAIVVHSLFNHFVLNPLLSTALLIVLMPLLVVAVFERSERATRDWLGAGLDSDVELLELILSGEIRSSHAGEYLESLRTRFPGAVVADMLCYLQIYLELALRAKGVLIARAAGVTVPVDPAVRANFEEMRFLERSIGPTGKLAVLPLLRTSGRDLWQLTMLGKA